ncbi:chymotrypsinogen A-like [Montipora capricornis]|uniref:chymotrypsinogen A-like n=1 Tax=Montipora capricornis TaxID=246305 RepID=UPI0035F18EA5
MISLLLVAISAIHPLLSEGCGVRPAFSRVINGQNASPHSWPWQVSLRIKNRHICGGSLIKRDWIVTAAHCVYRDSSPSAYQVVVGGHRLSGRTSVQQTFDVIKLFKHSGFTMNNLKDDIAVLQLAGYVKLSDKVNTVCLPEQHADLNSICYITGWGLTSAGQPARILQQARLPLASHSECERSFPFGILDQNAHLCAGASGSGGCNGDSGGPLACEVNGKWVLHGAVSFGQRNCPTTHHTVFTRITSYVDWINDKTGGVSTAPTPPTPPPPGTRPPLPPISQTRPPPPGCKDNWEVCHAMKHLCSDHSMQLLCKRTCNNC